MKIKIIDLLNKIANGEKLPKKIKFHGSIFELKRKYSYCEDYYSKGLRFLFNDEWALTNNLNDEVEIIEEEKEIEKIKSNGIDFYSDCINVWISKEETVAYCEFLMNKVNEVIDAVNEIRKEK